MRLSFLALTVLLVAVACTRTEQPAAEAPAPAPEGETLLVTSAGDDGSGTLRQALLDAQAGDTITFDAAAFPPDDPQTISVKSALPQIVQGNVTIDGSDAGVVLDGRRLARDTWLAGLEIVSGENTIRGMQVVNFSGTGIAVVGSNNTVGGDRSVGQGPIGQGNLTGGNDFGIGLWDPAATDNVVTGNLVGAGVDARGRLGNRTAGVWVSEGAKETVIGPDNVIAFNARCGIEVEGPDSPGNTITRNSIHDNAGAGICVRGGKAALEPPLIIALDLAGGLLSGETCANCAVEVFSDDGEEGATYEGDATADNGGAFKFETGSGLAKANITLTVTDADGTTSDFSAPVGRETGVPRLQRGNAQAITPLVPEESGDLADNRIGASAYSGPANYPSGFWPEILPSIGNDLLDLGVKRLDTSAYEIEPPIDWGLPEFDIPSEFDQLVDAMVGNGVAVDYMIHFWDKEGRGQALSTPRFATDRQIADFLKYVRFVVRHFKGRVDYYTIWSEPGNCGQGGIKCITSGDYVELARRVIPVIRAEDPKAKVATAPVVLFFDYYQGSGDPLRDNLRTLLRSDVVAMFDVIQWHGIYNVTPDDAFFGSYYDDYPSIVEEIKETAAAHGFRGEYWSTEMTYCADVSPGCAGPEAPGDKPKSDELAAKYQARAIITNLGMDVGVGAAVESIAAPRPYRAMRRLNTIMAGATPTELPVKISGAPANARIQRYGFKLPGGDTLFALWTDGAVVEDGPGTRVTVTFPGSSATNAVGLDVVHGFEQGLTTDTSRGRLVIRDLLVKDYPTILRLERSP